MACSPPAWGAPLFERTEGSLSKSLSEATRQASVVIRGDTLRSAREGSEIEIALPEVGTFRYRVVQRVQDGEVTRLDGVLPGQRGKAEHRLMLGVRAEGVSGVIDTPAGTFALGYANGRQWLAAAGRTHQWSAEQDDGRPALFTRRTAPAGEKAPIPGAEPIALDLARLTQLQPGEEATLPLGDLGPLRVRYDESTGNADSTTWVGHLKDFGTDFRVLLTYSPAGTSGHILTPQGDYAIESTAAGAAYLIDPRKLGMRQVQGDQFCPPPPVPNVAPAAAAGGAGQAATADAAAADGAVAHGNGPVAADAAAVPLPGSTVIDVLVLYTPGFAIDKGGDAAARTAIDHLLAVANQAYRDSAVPIVLRRVGADRVNVADKTDNSAMLNNLTNGTGAFSNVKARRNALGADLVTLVRPFWTQYQNSCGTGWIGGYNLSPITGSARYGYSVVSEGRDRGGRYWYCDVTGLAHELGHNMGLMHDRQTVAQQGGAQGAYTFAYGYGIKGSFGTVMSYVWPHVGKFSNPRDYTCPGGQRCGVPSTQSNSADNARALGLTRTAVAAFRPTVVATQLSISGVVTANGAPVAGATISGAPCTSTGSNGVYQCKVSPGFTGALTPTHVVNGVATIFSPGAHTYTDLQASVVNQGFAGSR
jgi:hypothetical protein